MNAPNLTECALATVSRTSLALMGPSGVGKSHALYALEDEYEHRAVDLNCQAYMGNEEGVLRRLTYRTWSTHPGLDVDGAVAARLDWNSRHPGLDPRVGWLLLVDEAQVLAQMPRALEALVAVLRKHQPYGLRVVLGLHMTGLTLGMCEEVLSAFGPLLEHAWCRKTHPLSPALRSEVDCRAAKYRLTERTFRTVSERTRRGGEGKRPMPHALAL